MEPKRPIDVLRDSARAMTIGDISEGPITGAISINGRPYVLKQNAIFRIAMADDIDPERTRIHLPDTNQLLLNRGSDSALVQRILLTGAEIFRENRLRPEINWETALNICLEMLFDAVAAEEIKTEYVRAKADAEASIERPKGGTIRLPAIPNLQSSTKSFIQKLDHAFQKLFELCCVFFQASELKNAGKWLEGFANLTRNQFSSRPDLVNFSKGICDFGKQVRNIRHCIEHPKATQRLKLTDYELSLDGQILAPTIEVFHPESPLDRMSIEIFMETLVTEFSLGVELLIAHLASLFVLPINGFPTGVGEIPEAQRQNGVRFGYLIAVDGKLHRLG